MISPPYYKEGGESQEVFLVQKDKGTDEEVRIGQKVKSLLTGVEYQIKKELNDHRVILVSEDGNASALVHKNHMTLFYVTNASDIEKGPRTYLPPSSKTPMGKF